MSPEALQHPLQGNRWWSLGTQTNLCSRRLQTAHTRWQGPLRNRNGARRITWPSTKRKPRHKRWWISISLHQSTRTIVRRQEPTLYVHILIYLISIFDLHLQTQFTASLCFFCCSGISLLSVYSSWLSIICLLRWHGCALHPYFFVCAIFIYHPPSVIFLHCALLVALPFVLIMNKHCFSICIRRWSSRTPGCSWTPRCRRPSPQSSPRLEEIIYQRSTSKQTIKRRRQ